MPLFIGPPFGNYIDVPFAISIKGSYTVHRRDGLWCQVLKTLRYSFANNGWINKIGLRNKGLDYMLKNYNSKHIYSLALLEHDDIEIMNRKLPSDANIEINISCPNAEKSPIYQGLKPLLSEKRRWCIVKLSPLVSMDTIDELYNQGFRQFHISNTMPVTSGGLSGPSLQQNNINVIQMVRAKYKDSVYIIGGGGIQNIYDVQRYKHAGANGYAISTVFFHPWKLLNFYVQWKKYSDYI